MNGVVVPIDMDRVKRESEELKAARQEELARFATLPAVYEREDITREEIMLPMEDGVCLKTYIVRPASALQIPVLVQRTPYPGQIEQFLPIMTEYARHGMAAVVQCCRGTGGSEGEWVPNIYERGDGLFTLNWLSEQSWVESIGYHGASYLSYTGWAMADALPDKVKGLYLSVYGTDRHASAYKDGLFRQDILTAWAMTNAGKTVNADLYESYSYKPQVEVDRKLWEVDLPWYRDWITHTDYEDPYWQSGVWKDLKAMPGKLKVPMGLEEGWYDHHLGGALIGYRDMPQEIREHSLLRIGAWRHSSQPLRIVGSVNADLYVKSDAEDTAFTIKVMEETADGHVYNIRTGIMTLAYRGHSKRRLSYEPGEIVKINIDTWDIAWTLQAGSRLRVDISSSDFPQYAVHSNYPGVWSLQDKTKIARQTIFTGEEYPSVLHVPYIN